MTLPVSTLLLLPCCCCAVSRFLSLTRLRTHVKQCVDVFYRALLFYASVRVALCLFAFVCSAALFNVLSPFRIPLATGCRRLTFRSQLPPGSVIV